jgi:hypothetical protein
MTKDKQNTNSFEVVLMKKEASNTKEFIIGIHPSLELAQLFSWAVENNTSSRTYVREVSKNMEIIKVHDFQVIDKEPIQNLPQN